MEEKLAMDNSSLRVLIRDLDQFGDLSLLKFGTLLFLVDLPNVIDECLGDPSKCAAWMAKAEETKKNSKTFAEDEEAFFENLHATGLQSTGGGMGAAEARDHSILYYTLVPGYSNSSPSLSKLECCLVNLKSNMSIVFRTQLGYVFDYPGYEMMVGRLIFKYQVMNNLLLVTSNKTIEGDRRNPKVSTNRPTDVNEYSTRRERLYKEGPFSNFYNQGILNTFQKDEKENIQVSNLLNIYKKLADEKKFNGGLYYADIITLVRYHNRVHIDVQTGVIPKSNIDKIDTFEAHFKRLMERLKDNRKLLFTQAQPFKWLLDRTSWCLIDSANPSLGLDTIFSDIETYFEKSAFAQGIHFDHFSYEEVEFYSPHFEDQISIMFPRSIFTTKIMFGLDPSFVIELFSSARFRMTDTRRFTQAETISHLGYFIGKMSADMDAIFLFICKCLCSFKTTSASKKLDSAGILKACVFLLDLIEQSKGPITKKILTREKNEEFYQKIYLASVAIAVSSVRAIEYEMLMTEELDVPTKPRFTHQDFSRYFLEVFLLDIISVAPESQKEEMINTFFFKLFGNPELCRDLSKEFFLYYFDEDIKGCKNPNRKEGFKLIYAHKDESKGMLSAKMMEFLSEVITGKIVFKRYSLESFLTNLGGLSEHDKPENHFEQFLKANRISSVDSGILKALADSSENAAVKAYLAKSEDKHAVLIKYVLDFIKNFDEKLTVEKLAGIRKLSQEKVELIEYICAEGKEEKPKFLIKRALQKQTELEGLTKVLGSIETVMEQSKNILSGHFPFYEKLISDLNTLKKDFNKMTIQELYAHPVYKIKLLIITPDSVKSWMEHNILMTYPLIQQEVTAKHDETKPGLEGYLTIFEDVQANYKTLFTRMAENPATFKIKDFDKYVIQTGPRFILENKDCFIKNYEILNALKMSDPAKDAFMRAANILYSTKKLLKIGRADLNSSKIPEKKLGSMEKLLEILDIEISADKLGSKALDLYNQIKDIPEEEISVGLIKEKDHNKIIDIDGDNFGQSCMFIMPPLINQIAKSEETMEFIKTKADEFIKAMNEEVETENMDLLRMLDKVNKHLKFISDTRNFELIAKEIALKMSYDLQDELENCLQHIEPQMKTEIQYLAAKTKKDTQYNLTIIRGLLAKSEFTMSYNPLEGRFGIGVKYTHKKNDHDEHSASKDLSIFEFEELMNSAKVLTARKIDDDDQIEEEVESKRILISFSELGKHIEVILEALNKLKEIGAINESFTYLVDQMNISCGNERFFSTWMKTICVCISNFKILPFSKTVGKTPNISKLVVVG
jgi:hypothetical protein